MSSIKMADIARMAGVSLATVGRVIHQNGYVSEEKRKEIEQIIEETGYVPNKIAQGLKNSRSKLIGHMTLFNPNMLFGQISEAVNTAAYKQGYHVLTLTSHPDRDDEKRQVEELIGHQVDGVIITSNPHIPSSLIHKFTKAHIPVVLIERTQSLPNVDCILIDDFQGAYAAVREIMKKGHKKIGFIGMKSGHEVERLRYDGYCKAIEDAGLEPEQSMIVFTDGYSIEEGEAAAQKLLSMENRPTAVFMTSDIFACGVMQYCYQKGIRIPESLSLIGYDNTLSALLAPPISSMGLPGSEIGEHAITMLEQRMVDFEGSSLSVMIKPILINRGTIENVNCK